MKELLVLAALGAVFVLLAGSICGLLAIFHLARISKRLRELEMELQRLKQRPAAVSAEKAPPRTAEPAAAFTVPPSAAAVKPAEAPAEEIPGLQLAEKPPVPPAPILPPRMEEETPKPTPAIGIEHVLGVRWLGRVGMVLLLVAGGYFLKYAYDNEWIGPAGRLAIGALLSVSAMGLGEKFRRKGWKALFQTLTGGGLAGLYICIFFMFQIYRLGGQGLAMGLATLVTMLAVGLAVAHNAMPVAVLAMLGGFLSPVVLSTGGNHPYILFSYIFIIDLVAMGAGYYRKWRVLDILAFAGTAAIYQGWCARYFKPPDAPPQMTPALIFTTLFYLYFLLMPLLAGLIRRLRETPEGIFLLAVNAFYSFLCYSLILFGSHRAALGYVALGQALPVLLLFHVWTKRQPGDRSTADCLLFVAMSLVTIAVPIHLRFNTVAVAWAAEGCALLYLGVRHRRAVVHFGGYIVLFLSALALFQRLPLHARPFDPVFNAPFGSWMFVIAAFILSAFFLLREKEERRDGLMPGLLIVSGFILFCLLATMETFYYWEINRRGLSDGEAHLFSTLVVLWSLISSATLFVILRNKWMQWLPLPLICYAVAGLIFLLGFMEYDNKSADLALNAVFLPRLAFILAILWGGQRLKRGGFEIPGVFFGVTGQMLLTLLMTVEMVRWVDRTDLVSDRMGLSLISALWAVQAFALVAWGLIRANRPLRILGIFLFGMTVLKVIVLDTSELEKIYRIVSFAASGLFLLLAGYCYQRFSSAFIRDRESGEKS